MGTHQGLMYHTLGQRKGLGIGGTKRGVAKIRGTWWIKTLRIIFLSSPRAMTTRA
ncbi:hypothetical protein LNP17_11700 [Klebsiella variicola subsp. variicola]|nr:hypothetical protein [Klebsiella variicola subsp. variicola]